jgi:hypothetical protein
VQELAYEVALEYHPPAELQQMYGVDAEDYARLSATPHFQRAVASYRRLIDEDTKQAKLKVKRLASVLIDEVGYMAADRTLDPSIRLRAIENLCRYADLDRPPKDDAALAAGTGFTVNIQVNNH